MLFVRLVSMRNFHSSPLELTHVIAFLYASHNSHINNSFIHDGAAPDSFPQSPLSFGDLPSHVIPIDPYDQLPHNLSRDASVGIQSSPAATSKEYDGWCFLCEDNRGFTTRGGFIRHMQEHYTKYYCIPEDLVRYTQGGRTCAKCGVSDPDPKHLNTHNDSKCIGKRYTRKENLEKHLTKKHRVRHASLLAEHSGHTTLQRYFACGFCVFCCGSFNEQIHHIDAHHYKFSVQICDWDDDKVIRGLLSQPGVKEYWRYALAAHPNIQESSLTWNNPHAKELQRRLEMSQEPAVVLCHAAIHESNYGKSLQGYIDSGSVHGFTDLERHTNRSNQMFQGGNVLSPVPYMPERGSVSRTPRVTAFTLRSQQPAVDSDNFDDSDWHAIHENGPFFQGTFDMHNKTTSTVYPHTDNRAQPWSSPDSAESPIHRQYSPYMSSNTSTSGTANAFQGQVQSSPTSRPGGNSSAIPPNLAADSPPFQGLKMHNYPAQARTGVLCSTVPAQFASPPLPRISETSSGGHLTSAHTPAHHQTLNIHYSRQDTTNHIGIDMAPGTDGQQPFTPNANRSRRWGRNR